MSWLTKLFGAGQSAPAPAAPAEPTGQPLAQGERVLVVDPSTTIQKVIELTLADQGCSVTAVTTGEQAMAFPSMTPPTVVLVSAHLADEGCDTVLEAVKTRPELEGTIVIAMTGAFDHLDDGLRSRIGPEALLTKPFASAALIDRIRVLRQGRLTRGA